MRLLGWFIVICVAMALAGVVAKIAVLAVIGLILAAFITSPRETALSIGGFLFLGLVAAHPGPGFLFLTALITFAAIQKWRE